MAQQSRAQTGAPPWPRDGLFARLRAATAVEWRRFIDHEFVRRLGRGTLAEPSFKHYLGQDYRFLIHFARAWGLAVYKSENLAEMRHANAALRAILDVEMGLHVAFCAGWGMREADMEALPEADATTAYTRFVLDRGLAGDLLDLETALAPCIIGYAEIAQTLKSDPATKSAGNPYRDWIEMYAGDEYRTVARAAAEELDRLWHARAGGGRFDSLLKTFRQATLLEAAFWQMGLDAG
ncbi:MAG TPA: thiaminase II [Alphaproteobacteria bacterium]|nr:thiaminase II [Alphaproteobacteria bacterium]